MSAMSNSQTIAVQLEKVRDKVPLLYERDDVLLSMIQQRGDVEKVSSRAMRLPLQVNPGGKAGSYNADGGDLGRGSGTAYDVATVSPVFYRFAVEITKLVEYASNAREKAIENAAKKEVVNGMKQFRAFLDKLVQTAGNGVLYGASTAGVWGSIAALRPPIAPGGTWTEGTVYAFTGVNGDACGPEESPAVGASGAMYGATSNGGAYRGAQFMNCSRLPPQAALGSRVCCTAEDARLRVHVCDYRGGHEVPLFSRRGRCHADRQQPAFSLAGFDILQNRPPRSLADYRPHIVLGLLRLADLDLGNARLQLFEECIVNLRVHDGARAGRALLARVSEC